MRDTSGTRRSDLLTRLAARQHGVFSLSQAEALGYSRSDVFRGAHADRFRRVFPRVYRIAGAPPNLEQRAMAATLWAPSNSVVSHGTAAALWGISPAGKVLHLTADRKLGRPPTGIRTHLARRLPIRERGVLRGRPITSVGRTLLDLAGDRTADELLAAVERAVLARLVTHGQLEDVIARSSGRRGRRRLEAVLSDAGSSALERRVASVLAGADLPAFVREHPFAPYRLDFAWPEQLVAIEADGRRWHSSSDDFVRDRAKHNRLVTAGWRILRVTWMDVERPDRLVEAVRTLLRDSA